MSKKKISKNVGRMIRDGKSVSEMMNETGLSRREVKALIDEHHKARDEYEKKSHGW